MSEKEKVERWRVKTPVSCTSVTFSSTVQIIVRQAGLENLHELDHKINFLKERKRKGEVEERREGEAGGSFKVIHVFGIL